MPITAALDRGRRPLGRASCRCWTPAATSRTPPRGRPSSSRSAAAASADERPVAAAATSTPPSVAPTSTPGAARRAGGCTFAELQRAGSVRLVGAWQHVIGASARRCERDVAAERGCDALRMQHPRRVVEGRARHQRHDGRRGPPAAPVPRRAHARAGVDHGGVDPLAAARRRHVGHVPRRARRPLHHGRGLRRAAPGRRSGRRRRTSRRPRRSSSSTAGSKAPASSPGCGWRCSGCGRGTPCRRLPPEVMLLPPWFPLNIYDFACWARQTIVPLTVVRRPPPGAPAAVRDRRAAHRAAARTPPRGARGPGGLLTRSTACCSATSGARGSACGSGRWPRPSAWIVARQEADGSWGGIQPPWVYSMMALHLRGLRPRPPGDGGRRSPGSTRFTRPRATARRRLEACQSPVWDTALAVLALADAGVAADDPTLVRRRRLAARRGDPRARRLVGAPAAARARWLGVRVRQRQLPRHRRHGRGRARPAPALPPARPGACTRPSTAGSRGCSACSAATAAGRRSTSTTPATLVPTLPFCDFGEVIDPPSADVTAHVVEMLAAVGDGHAAAAAVGAASSGCGPQEADGSWFGRWGANHVYGTGPWCRRSSPPAWPLATTGCVAPVSGSPATKTPTVAGVRTCAPTATPRWLGRGASTRVADGVGAARAARAGRAARRHRPRRRLPRAHPASRRHLGRALVHRNRVPGRLLHQLSPVPARVPADGVGARRKGDAWMTW